jgi:NADH dehydrogenase
MILVAGATGMVGGMIARALLQQRHSVRVLVREGSPYGALVERGARPTLGDLKDPRSLAEACRGVDVVVTTASAGERGGADTPQSVDVEGNRHLIEAASQAGVRQFVFVSALPASLDHPVPVVRAKAETELALHESGLAHTIIAANCFMDIMFALVVGDRILSGQPVTLVGEGRRRHSFVAARDVAAFAVAAVNHPAAVNRRIAVGGPDALSWRDVVAVYERALGRTATVQWIAPGELLPHLPPVPGLAPLVSGLMAGLEAFDSPVDMTDAARTFGVTPTSVDDFVASVRATPNAVAPAADART